MKTINFKYFTRPYDDIVLFGGVLMESREQRITNLATTLKSSGIAKSDSQARMMAEEMIGVEEHVQKNYEEEHAKAQEFLNTSKNLGRQVVRPIQQLRQDQSSSVQQAKPAQSQQVPKIQELAEAKKPAPEYTDTNFGNKPLSEAFKEHDTHNPAIEAIKMQMSQEKIIPLEDMEQKPTANVELNIPKSESIPTREPVQESSEKPVESENAEPKLDAQKLVEMMEEDGKLEEHTREIKEKPKDVKPKEAYAENNIDLSNMFNFGKR